MLKNVTKRFILESYLNSFDFNFLNLLTFEKCIKYFLIFIAECSTLKKHFHFCNLSFESRNIIMSNDKKVINILNSKIADYYFTF